MKHLHPPTRPSMANISVERRDGVLGLVMREWWGVPGAFIPVSSIVEALAANLRKQ